MLLCLDRYWLLRSELGKRELQICGLPLKEGSLEMFAVIVGTK